MASMFGFTGGKYTDESKAVVTTVAKAGANALKILGFNVRQRAQKSIKPVTGFWKKVPIKQGRFRKPRFKMVWVFPSSPVGTPPYTHVDSKRKRKTEGALPAAILYDLERDDASGTGFVHEGWAAEANAVVIGPSIDLLSTVGRPHEHAGSFRGETYPQRPFMGPALGQEIGSLPGLLAEQIQKRS